MNAAAAAAAWAGYGSCLLGKVDVRSAAPAGRARLTDILSREIGGEGGGGGSMKNR